MHQFLLCCFILWFAVSCNDNQSVQNRGVAARRADTAVQAQKTILFFGNSLTAGYGLEPAAAFPALIQKKIDSLQLPYKVVNAGVSGETSSGGNSRID